jgi:hypothetical protein
VAVAIRTWNLLAFHSYDDKSLDGGRSDQEVFDFIQKCVAELSDNRINIVSLRGEPNADSVSDFIDKKIREHHGVFVVLTNRVKDHLTNQWLPPPYVLTEWAYAKALYRTLTPWKPIFAVLEEGVDRRHLGLNPAGDANAPDFKRCSLDQFRAVLAPYVKAMLKKLGPDEHRDHPINADRLYKRVFVYRNGFVRICNTYRFNVLDPRDYSPSRLKHSIWRGHYRLGSWSDFLSGNPSDQITPYLVGECHEANGQTIKRGDTRVVFQPIGMPHDSHELEFQVQIFTTNGDPLTLTESCRLSYELMWGYPNAFLPRQDLVHTGCLGNAVGLRTAHRGPIADAVLEVYFERPWLTQDSTLHRLRSMMGHVSSEQQWHDVAPGVMFDKPPKIAYSEYNAVPAGVTPRLFYNDPKHWHDWEEMQEDHERSDGQFACFRKQASLSGQMRMIWMPHPDYHFTAADQVPPTIDGRGAEHVPI